MFCAIQAATRAGIRENEDAVWAQRDFLFVIDGATGLSGENYMDPVSDACWFAGTTARLLRDMLPENGPLPDILRGAMERVRLQWQGPEEAMPTASIAIWRCRGKRLELLQLGDCTASAALRDGSVRVWQEKALAELDRVALEQMLMHCRETGCSMEEARKWITPVLRKHRALHNRPGGYWTLDPTGAGISRARLAELPAEQCRSVCAWSDGFAQLSQFVPQWDAATLHKRVLDQGAGSLMDILYEKQERDRALLAVPRFKLRDDTSVAAAQIEEGQG